jgi:hypothetical protein
MRPSPPKSYVNVTLKPTRKSVLTRFWIVLISLLAAVKTAVWIIDRIPRFFLGDSAYYIWCAISGGIPSDRSFTYGKVISLFAGPQGDLSALIIGQIVISLFGTILLGVLLRSEFKASPVLVTTATLLMALEPLHLAYERFIMTEAIATPIFALFTFLAVRYLNRLDWRWLAPMAAVGAVLISFRLNMMLLTWAIAFLLPILAMLGTSFSTGERPSGEAIRRAVKHVSVALIFTVCAHSIYMLTFAALRGGRPAYNYAEGLFALASFAPIVQKDDFSDPQLGEKVFEQITFPLKDLNLREAHRWLKEGLVQSLIRNAGSEQKANRAARDAVTNAVLRDPRGAILVCAKTVALYFNKAHLKAGLNYDLGAKQFPIPDLKGLSPHADSLGAEIVGPSLVRWWHVNAWPWYMFLMLCPIWTMVLFFTVPPMFRAHALLFFALASGLLLTGPFLATMAVVRYLHPLSWMTFLTVALLLQAAILRISQLLKRPVTR